MFGLALFTALVLALLLWLMFAALAAQFGGGKQ